MSKSMGTVILSLKSAPSPKSSFYPSSSLGILPNASFSFPVSSKFPNPFCSFCKISPNCFLPQGRPSCAPTPGRAERLVFGKEVLSQNIFLQSPESHTTHSSLCGKHRSLLQSSFKMQNCYKEEYLVLK